MTLVSDKCALSYSLKLFALYQHQVNENIALMLPPYSIVLWFSLCNYNLVFVKELNLPFLVYLCLQLLQLTPVYPLHSPPSSTPHHFD